MASLTLKGIPDELLAQLKREAAEQRRSLNGEVLYRLERSVGDPSRRPLPGETVRHPGDPRSEPLAAGEPRDFDTAKWLQSVRALRERMNVETSVEEIIAARDEGRR
jgi:plasmid stability protein